VWFVGDVHSVFTRYFEQGVNGPVERNGYFDLIQDKDCSLQVGDILGKNPADVMALSPEHKFIRGNHDDPETCHSHPNYLGDSGYISDMDMFWVSGAFSIDYQHRIIGIDWWEDEELSYEKLWHTIDLYESSKPSIVVSHEAPTDGKVLTFANQGGSKQHVSSRTEQALQAMLEAHKPDIWIFGHFHHRIDEIKDGVRFVGLGAILPPEAPISSSPDEDILFEIPGLTWP